MCTGNDKLNFREFRDMMNKKSRGPSKSEGSTYDQKIIPTRKHKNKAEKQLFQIYKNLYPSSNRSWWSAFSFRLSNDLSSYQNNEN